MNQISMAEARRLARDIMLFAEHERSTLSIFDTILLTYGDAHFKFNNLMRFGVMSRIVPEIVGLTYDELRVVRV